MDLAWYDREIGKRVDQINNLSQDIAEYKNKINHCVSRKSGLKTYNCKANTGKTLNGWRDLRNLAQKELILINKDLTILREQRKDAVVAIETGQERRSAQADLDLKEALASGEMAQKYGKWLLLVVFGLGFGYFAIKKVKS